MGALTFLRAIFFVLDSLRANATPTSAATGAVLGTILGITPLLTPQWILSLFVVFLFRINIASVAIATVMSFGLSFPLDSFFQKVGFNILTTHGVNVWSTLYHVPLVPFTAFNHTDVMGAWVCTLVTAPILYGVVFLSVKRLKIPVYDYYRSTQVFKIYSHYRRYIR